MNSRAFIIPLVILMALTLAGGFVFLLIQNHQLQNSMEQLKDSVRLEGIDKQKELDILQTNLMRAAKSDDDVRAILGLAPVTWNWEMEENSQSNESEDKELQDLKKLDVFYTAIDALQKTQQNYRISDLFIQAIKADAILETAGTLGVSHRQSSTSSMEFSGPSGLLFRLDWSPEEGFLIEDPSISTADSLSGEAVLQVMKDRLKEQQSALVRGKDFTRLLRALISDESIAALIEEKLLKPRYYQLGTQWELALRLVDYSEVSRVKIDEPRGLVLFNHQSFDSFSKFTETFKVYLQELDPRTEVQKAEDQAQALVNSALDNKEFLKYAESMSYTVSDQFREDPESDYRLWDISQKGEVVGSIGLLMGTSELYLLDSDGIQIRSFRGFTETHRVIGDSSYEYSEDFEVISDLYSSSSSDTFLMIGTHEKNADTMILVHSDVEKGITHMLSIPRDLWYNNRKINSVYRYYGPDALVKEISELTGLEIDHYISVDMYAFIEVVDIMGGLDIELETPLIDPTYKIKENGQWTTLHYPAGPVHLDGLGALRVARSRHTSNDFHRGRRQQQVIDAMWEKALTLATTDIDALFKLISAALEYTDSDMNAAEILRKVMKYKDTDIEMGNVIDTTNILYSSYSYLYKLTEEEQKAAREDKDFNWGAWIVLPRNNDWNLIKWYIRDMIES